MFQSKAVLKTGKLNRKQRRAYKKHKKNQKVPGDGQLQLLKIGPDLKNAIALQSSKDFKGAQIIYERLLKTQPDSGELYLYLSQFHELQENLDDAYIAAKIAIERNPQMSLYWHNLSLILRKKGEIKAAILAREQAVRLNTSDPNLFINLAVMYNLGFQPHDALAMVETATKLDPENFMSHNIRGGILQNMGRFDEAKASYLRALEIQPNSMKVYQDILKSRDIGDQELKEILDTIETILAWDKEPADEVTAGWFAAAQIYDQWKQYDRAFDCYNNANRVARGEVEYNRDYAIQQTDELIEAFQPDVFERHEPAGSTSDLPVFVIGMPRSGTTLIERILASHTQVFGAGELVHLQKISFDLNRLSRGSSVQYPRDIKRMESEALGQIGGAHLVELRASYSSEALRIVDKMPMNYKVLGLISILYPNASIIHCMRNSVDTCWSCYTNNFIYKDAFPYAFDLEDVAFEYRQYRRLMDHWHKVLPVKILDVRYEELIADQEKISWKMIDHIGLDWEDECLNYHKNEQMVSTLSLWQVRQPIYKTSVERWRRYEKHLGSLKEALGPFA